MVYVLNNNHTYVVIAYLFRNFRPARKSFIGLLSGERSTASFLRYALKWPYKFLPPFSIDQKIDVTKRLLPFMESSCCINVTETPFSEIIDSLFDTTVGVYPSKYEDFLNRSHSVSFHSRTLFCGATLASAITKRPSTFL